jgi:hypothetical protein
MPHLEKWVMLRMLGPYQAIEQAYSILAGTVTGHSKFRDGTYVETSAMRQVDKDGVVTASGNRYTLGEPDPEYAARYPDARTRLLSAVE